MNQNGKKNKVLSAAKLALLAQEMRLSSGDLNILSSEPVAIVGIACRFPGGANTPALFWKLMVNGVDAISEVPKDRWDTRKYYHPDPTMPGKTITRFGGFLDHIDLFDPEFFGIAPREVIRMDPQHRLFLEVAFEALWDAGQTSKTLSGSHTGVFLAEYYNDYLRMQLGDASRIEAYTLSGTAHSLSVGRLSYLLNLQGPSMIVDTACSSSLVCVHLACQSLRLGESDMALAGGVGTIIRPEENIPLSKWGLLAPDGRCKTFDSRADGFVRGEGCGVVVLKRLSDAIRDSDCIHAIIRGTAVNQDGRSTFLTAPNGLSQQSVIRAALHNAHIEPAQISYVETHGTGTKLGDPIEVEALTEVVGKPRPDGSTCVIGSVKTNIGHLEAASGIAGLIKVVLSLQYERIPPHLHFIELNPMINLKYSSLVIQPEGASWLAGPQPRFAGVSSFGFGGTNAHAVLEEAPRLPLPGRQSGGMPGQKFLLPISARTWDGVYALAESYKEFLGPKGSGRNLRLEDICFTAGIKRDHLECRSSFIGHSNEEMITQIDRFLASRSETRPAGSMASRPVTKSVALKGSFETGDVSLESLGALYNAGHEIKWETLYPSNGTIVTLPSYPWQRQHYWIEEPTRSEAVQELRLSDSSSHPLLGSRIDSPFFTGLAFESFIGSERPPFIGQHRIFGRPVMPVSAFIEMLLSASDGVRLKIDSSLAMAGFENQPILIDNLTIHEPLLLAEEGLCRVQTGFTFQGETAAFQIFSHPINGASADTWKPHVSGRLLWEKNGSPRLKVEMAPFELRKAQEECAQDLNPERFYEELSSAGIEFGQAFRGIEAIRRGGLDALGRIRVTDQVLSEVSHYRFHPAWLDACLQVFGALLPHSKKEGRLHHLFIPTLFEHLLFLRRPAGPLWSCVHLRTEPKDLSQLLVGDAQIYDDNGHAIAMLDGVSLMAVEPEKMFRYAGEGSRNWIYQIQWRPQAMDRSVPNSTTSDVRPQKWLILAEHSGIAAGLKQRFLADGCECIELYSGSQFKSFSKGRYEVGPDNPEDFKAVMRQLLHDDPPSRWGIINLWGITGRPASDSLLESQKQLCGGMLHLIQALPVDNENHFPRLWVVSRGAMDVSGCESIDPQQATLWGLGSVLALERPDLGCTRIDLDPEGSIEAGTESLYNEIRAGSTNENQVAFRHGVRHVVRLVDLESLLEPFQGSSTISKSQELCSAESGLIEDLSFHPVARRPPSRGEIEIEVEAVGLNFRDVLNALRALPGMETPLGGECAGRIVRVGEAVRGFHPGDEVFALAIGSFRSFVTIPAQLAIRKPETLTFEEAASIPIVFLTAHYGLRHLAKLAAGERVLIHAASGGVGLAAVQISQSVGAEVFATAGSPEKREYLRSLGVPHVMDSRSLSFADEIMAKTSGEGIDVVLNSLSGEMIPKSLSLLRDGGRFLEIGKRGIWEESQVIRFKSGISYLPFDLGQVAQTNPGLIQSMLSTVLDEFRTGIFKPIRLTVFNTQNTADAFQTMARAKHIGKIIISFTGTDSRPKKPEPAIIRPEGTYLITGGLGALGLEVSRWLCDRGARYIVIVGRRGPTEAAASVLEYMKQQGVQIAVMSADLAQRVQLDEVLREIRHNMPPLCGVVHAAGVIDDGLLQNQSWQRFVKVMAPKIEGAWNLHQATKEMPLDFFVLFSSVASILGWQGQGAYAAGNAFLDALAHYRKRHGLTALSINWGPWAGTGMAAGLESMQKKRMEAIGLQPIGPEEALLALQRMLTAEAAQIIALKADWPKFSRELPKGIERHFFAEVRGWRSTPSQSAAGKESNFLKELRQLPSSERHNRLADFIERQAAAVLGIASGKGIDRHQPLREIGLDSLMAVELRNSLCNSLKCTLTPTLLFDYPTIETLVDYVAGQALELEIGKKSMQKIPEDDKGSPDEGIAYLKSISDADAEALLMEELKRLSKDD
jgi:myxalamid-type polyketide synthase MxaB